MEYEFWAVWRKAGGAPSHKRHSTKAEAIEEAASLAQQTGEKYYIIEVTTIVGPTTHTYIGPTTNT